MQEEDHSKGQKTDSTQWNSIVWSHFHLIQRIHNVTDYAQSNYTIDVFKFGLGDIEDA